MREGRSYEGIRNARDCFMHVQIHFSIYRNEECPPQKRRALGYFVTEVGRRLEFTQGGVSILVTWPVAAFEINQRQPAGHQMRVLRGASVRQGKNSIMNHI